MKAIYNLENKTPQGDRVLELVVTEEGELILTLVNKAKVTNICLEVRDLENMLFNAKYHSGDIVTRRTINEL